jgi:hypothetical protein
VCLTQHRLPFSANDSLQVGNASALSLFQDGPTYRAGIGDMSWHWQMRGDMSKRAALFFKS